MVLEMQLPELKRVSDLHEAIESIRERAGDHAIASPTARAYSIGDHDMVVDPVARQMVGLRALREPKENIIGQCLRQIAGRMLFNGFTVNDTTDLRTYLVDMTRKNGMRSKVIGASIDAMVDGSTALSVSWDSSAGRPVVHTEAWWDGNAGMFVMRDTSGEVRWAVSDWYDNTEAGEPDRRTIYLPDRILRFHKPDGAWALLKQVPWVKSDGSPLGVPVAHLPNGPAQRGSYYPASTVEEVLAQQDELNGVHFDRTAVSALSGAPIYTATGVQDSEQREHQTGPGQRWTSQNDAADFGVLQPGSMDGLMSHTVDLRSSIAAAFPVPLHRIGVGQWPSGLALVTADAPMIAQIKLLHGVFEHGLSLIAHRAVELHNTFGPRGRELPENELIGIDWDAPDQVDPATQLAIDRERIDNLAALERLTPTMMRKSRLLTEDEVVSLIAERDAMYDVVGDANAGGLE